MVLSFHSEWIVKTTCVIVVCQEYRTWKEVCKAQFYYRGLTSYFSDANSYLCPVARFLALRWIPCMQWHLCIYYIYTLLSNAHKSFQRYSEITGLGIWRPGFCIWLYHQLLEGLKQCLEVELFTQLHWIVRNPILGNNKCQDKSVLLCGFCSPLMNCELGLFQIFTFLATWLCPGYLLLLLIWVLLVWMCLAVDLLLGQDFSPISIFLSAVKPVGYNYPKAVFLLIPLLCALWIMQLF